MEKNNEPVIMSKEEIENVSGGYVRSVTRNGLEGLGAFDDKTKELIGFYPFTGDKSIDRDVLKNVSIHDTRGNNRNK